MGSDKAETTVRQEQAGSESQTASTHASHCADKPPVPKKNFWHAVRYKLREPFAEFLGTMVMVCFLESVVAQVSLSKLQAGEYIAISLVTALAATVGVLIAGPVSGGHLNPAVTLAFVVFRGLPGKKAIGYVIGQMLGGFMGAAITYANYRSAIDAAEGYNVRTHKTARIFSTYPQPFLTKTGQFFSEFIGAAFLVISIFAMCNPRHSAVVRDLAPLWLFFIIVGIGAGLGWQTGYAINMARDFAPRCFAYLAGYGGEVFSFGDYYYWVPVVAPLLGAIAGGLVFDILVFDGDSPVNRPISLKTADGRYKGEVIGELEYGYPPSSAAASDPVDREK